MLKNVKYRYVVKLRRAEIDCMNLTAHQLQAILLPAIPIALSETSVHLLMKNDDGLR